jgi:hypothetical protein
MDTGNPNAKDHRNRLFAVVPGASSQYATLESGRRLTWPKELHEWLVNFRETNLCLIAVGNGCLLMISSQDYDCAYHPLIGRLIEIGRRSRLNFEQMATSLIPHGVEIGVSTENCAGKRFRMTIPRQALAGIPEIKEGTDLILVAKRRWAEIWNQSFLSEWRKRLFANTAEKPPLPPPPFTPDIIVPYIEYLGRRAPPRKPPGASRR